MAAKIIQSVGGVPEAPAHECSVCLEVYGQTRHARILHCGHTFCEECIGGLLAPLPAADRHHKALSCPKCRESTMVAHGDVTVLVRNFDIE